MAFGKPCSTSIARITMLAVRELCPRMRSHRPCRFCNAALCISVGTDPPDGEISMCVEVHRLCNVVLCGRSLPQLSPPSSCEVCGPVVWRLVSVVCLRRGPPLAKGSRAATSTDPPAQTPEPTQMPAKRSLPQPVGIHAVGTVGPRGLEDRCHPSLKMRCDLELRISNARKATSAWT